MPRDGTATRARILDAAERLVIEQGYAATSVEQVLAASGSSKGAFFHHFPSKRELARTLVERYAEADVANLREGLAHARATATGSAARLDTFLAFFEEQADEIMTEQSSCLYLSILTERGLVDDGTSGPIVGAVLTWRHELSALVRDALAGREDAPDPVALADHVFVTFEGAFLLARSTGDPSHMRAQLRVLRALVAGVVRPDPVG